MKKSQLLHFDDPLCLEFNARIVEMRRLTDGRSGVVLDRTYFYPTGGGQEHDIGMLGAAQVLDVFKDEERGVTVHVVDRSPGSEEVHAVIDRPRRLRHMQHHTAQHLLSHCCIQLLGLETVSANINGDTPSTLDLNANQVDKHDLLRVEILANQIVTENRPVRTYFVSPERLHTLPLRKPPKVEAGIRIVEIDGLDYSACGGTHVAATGNIGVIKILRTERVKEKTRLHFVAGSRAVEYFQMLHEIVSELAAAMSVHPQDLGAAVERQGEQLKAAQRELGRLQSEIIIAEARELYARADMYGDCRLALRAFSGRTMNDLRALAKELRAMPGAVAVLISEEAMSSEINSVLLVAACAEDTGLSAQGLLRRLLLEVGGKGGGDAALAQGAGKIPAGRIPHLLDVARATAEQMLVA